ncbi:MAG: UDP-4-amino-4-deoxy-L-arabinose aminotransferase [Phycisphaerae bacterium]|nr:UDP-4-amino-4-deoxy-L-arabinose aminotransferase [Phycisphaerae bacterium]|tara:strand:- start:6014 stop:7210 length:1197 start_codon:yes stop_codon:yes gene_type:complete
MDSSSSSNSAPAFLPFCSPSIDDSDIAAVVETLRSGWITTGPRCGELEQAICDRTGAGSAVVVSSATAAMHLVLTALGIGPGDEVITPSMTWVSTPNMIHLMGATPVFVDVDRDTLLVSAESIEAAITARTKAIIPVHYAGVPCDLDSLRAVAKKHGIPLIEDAAHAIGTRYRSMEIGQSGHAIFSLHPIKNITTGEGGILVSDDPSLADEARRLRFHGLAAEAWDRDQQGRSPQVEVQSPGYKYNLPDMNATLGLTQLKRLDEFIERRTAIAKRYLEELADVPGVEPLAIPEWDHLHAWHLFVVRVDEAEAGVCRERFMSSLKEMGIGTGIHFRATHTHRWYRENGVVAPGGLENSTWNSERICSIPFFPNMTDSDVDRVLEGIRSTCPAMTKGGST